MEVEGAGGLELFAELDEAREHYREIGHHVVWPEDFHEGAHDAAELVGAFFEVVVGGAALVVPLPCVLECLNLRGGGGAVLFLKEGVVILRAVEGRIEIDEIDRLIGEVAPKDVEIVALVEGAHEKCAPS